MKLISILLALLWALPSTGAQEPYVLGSKQVNEIFKPATLPRHNTIDIIDKFLSLTKQTHWIQEGQSNVIVYAYFDFGCPGCISAYKELSNLVKQGKVSIRWIFSPVSVNSSANSKAVLAQIDRLKTMSIDDIIKTNNPHILAQYNDSQIRAARVEIFSNLSTLLKYSKARTPLFVYENGESPIVFSPKSLPDFLTSIGIEG
jgi:hypothetical protein